MNPMFEASQHCYEKQSIIKSIKKPVEIRTRLTLYKSMTHLHIRSSSKRLVFFSVLVFFM